MRLEDIGGRGQQGVEVGEGLSFKSEARNPKQILNPNIKCQKCRVGGSFLVFTALNLLGISCFGFQE